MSDYFNGWKGRREFWSVKIHWIKSGYSTISFKWPKPLQDPFYKRVTTFFACSYHERLKGLMNGQRMKTDTGPLYRLWHRRENTGTPFPERSSLNVSRVKTYRRFYISRTVLSFGLILPKFVILVKKKLPSITVTTKILDVDFHRYRWFRGSGYKCVKDYLVYDFQVRKLESSQKKEIRIDIYIKYFNLWMFHEDVYLLFYISIILNFSILKFNTN